MENMSANDSDKSLEAMVSELRQAHVSQLEKIKILTGTISKMEKNVQDSDRSLKKTLKSLSTLIGENIWYSKEIQSLERECEDRLKDIDRLVDKKSEEEDRLRNMKQKVQLLERKKADVYSIISSHKSAVKEYSTKYVDKEMLDNLFSEIQQAENKRESLKDKMRQLEDDLNSKRDGIVRLENEISDIDKQEDEITVQILEKEKNVTENYETQVENMNKKIAQLQSVHNSHKIQLRELNRVISTNSYHN